MKAVAIISEPINTDSAVWQFDKIMSAIAYDLEITVVFMSDGIDQLTHSKAWKSLKLYGIDEIYALTTKDSDELNPLVASQNIDTKRLRQLIQHSDIIL